MSKEFTQRCEAVGLKEGSLFTWLEKVETLQAENAALKEQVAQLEFRNERLVADYAELQGLNENHAFNAKYFKAASEKSAALVDALEQSRIGLVQWHVPENRYSAINAIDDALAAFKGEK